MSRNLLSVRQWEEVGAIVVGKLNMHEYGLGKQYARFIVAFTHRTHERHKWT